jgi:hypothetical protein
MLPYSRGPPATRAAYSSSGCGACGGYGCGALGFGCGATGWGGFTFKGGGSSGCGAFDFTSGGGDGRDEGDDTGEEAGDDNGEEAGADSAVVLLSGKGVGVTLAVAGAEWGAVSGGCAGGGAAHPRSPAAISIDLVWRRTSPGPRGSGVGMTRSAFGGGFWSFIEDLAWKPRPSGVVHDAILALVDQVTR